MSAPVAQEYKTQLSLGQDEKWGYFSTMDANGRAIAKRCVIIREEGMDYFIRYFDERTQTFAEVYMEKMYVTRWLEVEELAYWVIKNKTTGRYYSSSSSPSSCPSIYSTKGRAEGRRKCLRGDYEVVKWVISEREA